MRVDDDQGKLLKACRSLDVMEGFTFGKKDRFILVGCIELGAYYTVNLWCDESALATEIEMLLKAQGITTYRSAEDSSTYIAVAYSVNDADRAALTVAKAAEILKVPVEPNKKQPFMSTGSLDPKKAN